MLFTASLVAQTLCRRPGFDPWVRKICWRRKWQLTPVFLPRKSHGWKSLVGYSPWDCKELDMTEQLTLSLSEQYLYIKQELFVAMGQFGQTQNTGVCSFIPQMCAFWDQPRQTEEVYKMQSSIGLTIRGYLGEQWQEQTHF